MSLTAWRPFSRLNVAPLAHAQSSQGAFIQTQSGQKLFDGISSWWLITLGHNAQFFKEALFEYAINPTVDQIVFADLNHSYADQLLKCLHESTHQNFEKAFFSDNGSTAIEVALKFLAQRHLKLYKKAGHFISFSNGYHGDTCGALSLQQKGRFKSPYEQLTVNVEVINQTHGEKVTLDNLKEFLEKNPQAIAGLIIEPLLQGAGGMMVSSTRFVDTVIKLCRLYDVPVVFDEVMTGFYRTGCLFAYQQLLTVPDILCLSKGLTGGTLPMGLTLFRSSVLEAFASDDIFFHGHSFTASPLVCFLAFKHLRQLLNPSSLDLISTVSATQKRMSEKLEKLGYKNVRHLGTLTALTPDLDLPYGHALLSQLKESCLKDGLYMRPLSNALYILPPYCSSEIDIEGAWDILLTHSKRLGIAFAKK